MAVATRNSTSVVAHDDLSSILVDNPRFPYENIGDFVHRPIYAGWPEPQPLPVIAARYEAMLQATVGYTDAQLEALAYHFARRKKLTAEERKQLEDKILAANALFEHRART